MIVGLTLLLYGTLVAVGVPRLLDGAAWTGHAPRLAIVLWQALTGSVLLALVLAGLSGAMSSLEVSGSVGQLLHACAVLLREQYGTTGGGTTGVAGLILAAVIPGRTLWAAIQIISVDRRGRRTHLGRV